MKQIVSILLLAMLSFSSYSQYTEKELTDIINNSSAGQLVRENTQLLLVKIYSQSIRIADKLLQTDTENANYNYRKGYALLYSNSDYSVALPYLIKANKSVSKNYDGSSATEKNAPIDAVYHLAHCYHLYGSVDSAITLFNKYISLAPRNNELVKYSEFAMKQCLVAKEAMKNPRNYVLKNVGDSINSKYPDYSPVISLDGNSLYFTSRRLWEDSSNFTMIDPASGFYFEDIYLSYKNENGEWTKAKRLEFCKRDQMEATVSVSSDERTIYTYEDKTGKGDIYYTKFNNGFFEDVEPLDVPNVNSSSWETHLTVSADGQRMFFVSDRPGGFGGRDIYIMRKLPNGEWSLPSNLGPKINTVYDEDSPFISVDNKSLYFASNGITSMGGFDVFLSILVDENEWSAPVNLGYPLNSTADDIFYTTTIDGLTGYLTSVRRDGFGDKDIYEIKNDQFQPQNIAVLKGKINTVENTPLPTDITVTLVCNDCGTGEAKDLLPRNRDGRFLSTLEACRKYTVVYKRAGEEFYHEDIETNCDMGYQEINVSILLRLKDMKVIPFDHYNLIGNLRQKSDKMPIENAKVQFINPSTKEVVEEIYTDNSGNFSPKLLDGKSLDDTINYQVRISKKDYLTQLFDVNKVLGDTQEIVLNYQLEKMDIGVDIGKVLNLSPINFDLNKSNIRPDAQVELDKIVKIMNDNPTIKVELSSHTDCRGSDKYNMALSQRRAKSSADYIKDKITNPERIYGKGYGETRLLNDCNCTTNTTCTEEEHAVNRRTEFTIVKKD